MIPDEPNTAGQMPGSVPGPTPLILDTDLSTDIDDVGALAAACAYHRLGEIQLLGVTINSADEWAPQAAGVLCTYLGVPDVVLGAYRGELAAPNGTYTQYLAERFTKGAPKAEAPDAVAALRRLLAERIKHEWKPDTVLVRTGFQTNLAGLLASGPDDISPYTGLELIAASVQRLVIMGGMFPEGKERNIRHAPAQARAIALGWPTTIIYVGFEAGEKIITGATLASAVPEDSPVRAAYLRESPGGRSSWDPLAVMVAVEGTGDFRTVWGTVQVDGATGENAFFDEPSGLHGYIRLQHAVDYYAERLEALITSDPHQQAKLKNEKDEEKEG